MSRFFEALTQANSSTPDIPAAPVEAKSIDLGIDDILAPIAGTPQADRPVTAAPLTTTPVVAPADRAAPDRAVSIAPAVDPWRITSEKEVRRGRDRWYKGEFTALARVAVDQNVRIIPNAIDRAVVEHYRRLRTKLMQQHAMKPFRSVLVTSANPQEGKSVTVLNLGLSFAMMPSFRVLVVDGDMRRNTLGKWLGVSERPGFSNLIDGSATLDDVVFTCEDSPIHFIVGGTSKTPPAELLHSAHLGDHFRNMTQQFDLVLVDSPPVNLIADAQLLAAHSDAVLLVARAFKTSKKAFEKAVQDLLPFRVVGTVLNSGTRGRVYGGYSEYY